jgi:hypothetical protein
MRAKHLTQRPQLGFLGKVIFRAAQVGGGLLLVAILPLGLMAGTASAVTAPTVTSISPDSGPLAGGTVVSIIGTGFAATGTTVEFGSVAGTSVTCTTTTCSATSPAGTAGTVDVTVSVSGTASSIVTADKFTYTSGPAIASINPSSGPTAGGTVVTITGTGFATTGTTVDFGTVAGTSVTCASATSCLATSPAGSAGMVDITVMAGGDTSTTGLADEFTYTTAPTVASISPDSGPLAGGTVVTITGTGFSTTASTVDFGTGAGTSVTCASATSCVATSPAGSAGAVDVTVSVGGIASATGTADKFTYTSSSGPSVTSVSPNSGPLAGGTVVTITGTGFSTTGTTVDFGSVAGTTVTCAVTTSCSAISPAGSAGAVDVTVTTGGATSATGTADKFTYTSGPAIVSVIPNSGPLAGGTVVTIAGTGFATTGTTVDFGTVAGTAVTCSSTSCVATSPAGTAGAVDVTVTGGGNTSIVGTEDKFTYTSGPAIASISPDSGPLAGGTVVTISGTGFSTTGSTVDFGTVAGTSVTCSSATSCVATSPAGTAGAVDVTVTAGGNTSIVGLADLFTYSASSSTSTTTSTTTTSSTTTPSGSGTGSGTSDTSSSGSGSGLAFTGSPLFLPWLIIVGAILLIMGSLGRKWRGATHPRT